MMVQPGICSVDANYIRSAGGWWGGEAGGDVCCIITIILYWLSRQLFITVPTRWGGSYSPTEARKEKFAFVQTLVNKN